MKAFDLKIGFKCNNNCRHCVVAEKRGAGDLPLPKILEIISSLHVDQVTVTGGEPSTYSYLPEILKALKEKNIRVVVQTNATGFADQNFCLVCSQYIDHAHVAIHSVDPQVHDNIVQSPGMWEKTIEGFKNLKANGVFCTTQTVLSKFNINTLYETYQFIQEMAPETVMSMTYPHLMGNALKNIDEVAFRYSDYKDVLSKCLRDFHDYLFLESIPLCYVYPYQDMTCGSLEDEIVSQLSERVGIDFSDGFTEKNYNSLDVSERRKAPRCLNCYFNQRCIGVWKEYIQYFKDKLDLYPIPKTVVENGNQ